MKHPLLHQAQILLKEALELIEAEQNPDGSFTSLSSSDTQNFATGLRRLTTFQSSLILSALSEQAKTDPVALGICEKASRFLLGQKSTQWSWNYWVRLSPENKTKPYPDDLDDTFLALSALQSFDSTLVTPEGLAQAVSILTKMETTEGGPYRTWMTRTANNTDEPDVVVNTSIAYFLSFYEIRLPKVRDFLKKRVRSKDPASPYYPSLYPVVYFISRLRQKKPYREIAAPKLLISLIKEESIRPLSTRINVLDCALKFSSLIRLDAEKNDTAVCLQALIQGAKNGWHAEAFCVDPTRNGKKHYGGSAALTAAFSAEALQLYISSQKNTDAAEENSTLSNALHENIVSDAKKLFSSLEESSRIKATERLNTILASDKQKEITMLPYFFWRSIQEKGNALEKKIPNKHLLDLDICKTLGTANLCGWLGYSIIDDALDEENHADLIIPALQCIRKLTSVYQGLPNAAIQESFRKIMSLSDSAHDWEISHCRFKIASGAFAVPAAVEFGDFSRLAEKSLGHALGPIAVLITSLENKQLADGLNKSRQKTDALTNFFRHYLIARQLNDDAHDWREDIEAGRLTPATNLIFELWREKYPQRRRINMRKSLPCLQKIFWDEAVSILCREISKQADLADSYLKKLRLPDPAYFFAMTHKQKSSAEKALTEKAFVGEMEKLL